MRRRLNITRQGRWFVGITFAVGIGALNTGNNLLFLCLGLMLSIITVSGILSELDVVDVEVKLPAEALFVAGAPQFYEFEVHNEHHRRTVYAVCVRVRWRRPQDENKNTDAIEAKSTILLIKPKGKLSVRGEMRFSERGEYRLREILLETEFPFGLFKKTRVVHGDARVLVAPAPEAYSPPMPLQRTPTGDHPEPKQGHSIEPFELYEAKADEDVRNIAWAKSAARGQLVGVKRAGEVSDAIVLALTHGESGEAVFERALRHAASVVMERMQRGAATALVTGDGASLLGSGRAHETSLMMMLALAQAGASHEQLHRAPPAPVVWVQ